MKESDPFSIDIPVRSEAELRLVLGNTIRALEKIEERIADADSEIKKLVIAIISTKQIRESNEDINKTINALMEESEKLIDSPDANTPLIKAKRKEIADEINELLEVQQKIRDNTQISWLFSTCL